MNKTTDRCGQTGNHAANNMVAQGGASAGETAADLARIPEGCEPAWRPCLGSTTRGDCVRSGKFATRCSRLRNAIRG